MKGFLDDARDGGGVRNGRVTLKGIEFERNILNELRNISEADGLKSVYQVIRNACYHYVSFRKEQDKEQ